LESQPEIYMVCSKCGEVRYEKYTCRDGGKSVPLEGEMRGGALDGAVLTLDPETP
jgi:hypothetical protein